MWQMCQNSDFFLFAKLGQKPCLNFFQKISQGIWLRAFYNDDNLF